MMYPIRSSSSLLQVAKTLSLRCDAKQTEPQFLNFDNSLASIPTTFLNYYLPEPFAKGRQPIYVEEPGDLEIAYVVSTLSVQAMKINAGSCRFITKSNYDNVGGVRQLRTGDIVLTMDGGSSIGKVAVFDRKTFADEVDIAEEDAFVTVDSHVAILRPTGISSLALAHLLASPLGQLQFLRAESGASGQTAVTEDDVRYFRFPAFEPVQLQKFVDALINSLTSALKLEVAAGIKKREAWVLFEQSLTVASSVD